MKRILQVTLSVLAMFIAGFATAQNTVTGNEAEKMIPGAESIITTKVSKIPTFVKFRSGSELDFNNFNSWLSTTFNLPINYGLLLLNIENDKQLNMLHYRYRQTINGLPLDRTMMIVHTKNNKVVSVSAEVFENVPNISDAASLTEEEALNMALSYMNADSYRWQSTYQEKQLKKTTGDPNATWYPKAELVYAPVKGVFTAESYRLAYKFDIYAEKPVKRNYIYVDALTGEIILDENRIHDVDVPATAHTQYSGIKTMMTSGSAGNYVMSEVGRGNGIHTYNNQTNNNPQNVDFVNVTTTWNQVNPQLDQYATDAHYGAEKTYDFYDSLFGRNSIDGAGFALFSYVHVQVNLVNAFWDGTEMNYGDGDFTTYTPLTSMEITGHEITHGFTQFTAGFSGGGEPGGMNEGFSDCFGVSVRRMGQQTNVDWLIGDQIGGGTFRDMQNPLNTGNPICYQGANWDFNTQEVHQNSTPFSHCYYLVTEGGSGTNEFSQTYNVTALGLPEAEQIWYRMQAFYNMPNSQYIDARTNSIQAATDLYGGCSTEVISVTNAWYAVHVGAAYVPTAPIAGFNAATNYCSLPASVSFTNTTTNGGNYIWYFGDGDTSSLQNPTHIYLTAGSFTVKLVATSACGTDSVTQTNYIVINPPAAPTSNSPVDISCGGIATLQATGADTLKWYNQAIGGNLLGTGSIYVTPSLNSNTTYYVSSNIISTPVFCPPASNTIVGAGSDFTNSNPHGEVFNVLQPCTLVSVLVYATGAGNRTINLLNSSQTVINTATVNIPNGTSTVTLNFPLTVGTGYTLSCGDNTNATHLYRNTSGAAFPYTDPGGYITITDNDIPDGVHYYFFYDWKLEGPSCVSARTPVNVIITGGPIASFTYTQNGPTLTFTNTSTGSTSWLWNFGDGNTSTLQNPVHTYLATGTYTVTLTAYNNGCLDSTTQTVVILTVGMNTYDLTNALNIYPNPTDGLFNVSAKFTTTEQLQVSVMNTLGQVVYETTPVTTNSQLFTLDLRTEAKGIYFVQLKTLNGTVVRKLVLN